MVALIELSAGGQQAEQQWLRRVVRRAAKEASPLARAEPASPCSAVGRAEAAATGALADSRRASGRDGRSEVLTAVCRARGSDLVDMLEAPLWEITQKPFSRLGMSASDVALAA